MPDIEKLISAIELRLAALDINSRQASQAAARQFGEIGAQAAEAASGFRQCVTGVAGTDRTLSWHTTLVRRMSAQVSRKAGR